MIGAEKRIHRINKMSGFHGLLLFLDKSGEKVSLTFLMASNAP